MVDFYFCAWHVFHPGLFDQNRAFERVLGLVCDVKIFSGLGMMVVKKIVSSKKPCDSVKPLLNKADSSALICLRVAEYMVLALLYRERVGGQSPLLFVDLSSQVISVDF